MNAKQKRSLQKIIPFGIISMLFSLLYTLIEKGILGESSFYPSTTNHYSFSRNLLVTAIASLIFGLSMGWIEISYLSKLFKKRRFLVKILLKTSIYLFSMISFLLITSMVNNMIDLNVGITNGKLWESIGNFFFNWAFWSIEIYICCLIIISLLYAEFTDYLGVEVVKNFFTGKYQKSREEKRAFMFLDMKSSTTIAENLGHVKYFDLLRDYYDDLSDPILESNGIIYQYVGDEVVVSWKLEAGKTIENCLRCFDAMKNKLTSRSDYYQMKYGEFPSFKAGIHCGRVATGEIGRIKKDITFTGDVLNTTARIQGLCNSLSQDMLLSKSAIENMPSELQANFQSLGDFELKGKLKKIELFKRK